MDGFVVLFIVFGFESIRKELLALRRAMNLSRNDNEIEPQIAEKES